MANMNDPAVKGILKASGTYTKNYDLDLKSAKFDEVNIMNTFHPVGKDYGHMIIDEPKTPWVCEDDLPKELDTNVLIEKLRMTSKTEMPAFGIDGDSEDSSADEDYPESLEEKVRRTEFERRRKLHYKEFFSVPLARRLISEEFSEWTSESSSHSHQGEESMSCSEVCPESELEILDAQTPPTSFANTPTEHGDMTPQPDVEPGFDPSHPCYHKLVAEIDLDNRTESLSHLHSIPSGSSHQMVIVPQTTARPTTILTDRKSMEPFGGEPKARVCHANFPDMPNNKRAS